MSTFQNVLSGFAAIVAAFYLILRPITNNSKATGMAVLPAILLSWQCWVLVRFSSLYSLLPAGSATQF